VPLALITGHGTCGVPKREDKEGGGVRKEKQPCSAIKKQTTKNISIDEPLLMDTSSGRRVASSLRCLLGGGSKRNSHPYRIWRRDRQFLAKSTPLKPESNSEDLRTRNLEGGSTLTNVFCTKPGRGKINSLAGTSWKGRGGSLWRPGHAA